MSGESIAEITTLFTILTILSLDLVYFYSSKNNYHVLNIVLSIGWLIPLLVNLLLPLDLTSSEYTKCIERLKNNNFTDINDVNYTNGGNSTTNVINFEDLCDRPALYLSKGFLAVSWKVTYWLMFSLTLVCIPFLQGFLDNGYFTIRERAYKSLKANFINYALMISVGLIIVLYLTIKGEIGNPQILLGYGMAIVNLLNLTFAVLVVSFGLVRLPRIIWWLGDCKRELRRCEYECVQVRDSLADVDVKMEEICTKLQTFNKYSKFHDASRAHIDTMLAMVPDIDEFVLSNEDDSIPPEISYSDLTSLNKELTRTVSQKQRYQYEWDSIMLRAFLLQDVCSAKNSSRFYFQSTSPTMLQYFVTLLNWDPLLKPAQFLDFIWFVKISPIFYKVCSICLAIMSIIVCYAHVTYLISINGKPISIIGNMFQSSLSTSSLEILSWIFLGYMNSCALNTIFKIKVFNSHGLHYRHTSGVSLCWFTSLLCRLAFPLCFNFVNLTGVQRSDTTAFSEFMSRMDFVYVIGETVQSYVPVLVTVVCVLDFFDVFTRISRLLGFGEDWISEKGADFNTGSVEDGKILISDARNAYERKLTSLKANGSDVWKAYENVGKIERRIPDTDNSSSLVNFARSYKQPVEQRKEYQKKEFTSNYIVNNPLYDKYRNKGSSTSGTKLSKKEDWNRLLHSDEDE